ncbi:MAG: hypothetical protein ABIK47_03470 [candidate division WOR-3 bacterium]
MRAEEKKPKATEEKISRVDFDEVERIRSGWRSLYDLLIIVAILAGILILGYLYLRNRGRPEPIVPQTPASQNIWIPGVDYQPKPEEGE